MEISPLAPVSKTQYACPKHWYDFIWLRDRPALDVFFNSGRPLQLSLDETEWMDLQPLLDLLLLIDHACISGKNIEVRLPGRQSSAGSLRTLRFLIDTGFFRALLRHVSLYEGRLTFTQNDLPLDLKDILDSLEHPQHPLPPRALNYAVLIPCLIVDVQDFGSRLAVFDYCYSLKSEHLRGKPRQLGLSADLVYQVKVFFDSVLPELIDNVRIHKPDGHRRLAVFARLRKREERLFQRTDVVEAPWVEMTDLNKRTQHLWQFDIAEAAFADTGPGIQESWLSAWRRNNPGKRIPRLPESNKRVDGPDADAIILSAVFDENMSSLTPTERLQHDLPTVLTGLRSIREAIHSLDWHFSVRSGANYTAFSSGDDEDAALIPKRGVSKRAEQRSPGVQYLFRFADQNGRPLKGWKDAVPESGVDGRSQWWTEPAGGAVRPMVVFQYDLPAEAKAGDVVLCRPAHCFPKGLLLRFLNQVAERNVRLVFCDIPEPIALRLSLLIRDLMVYDRVKLVVPIVTNTWRVNVPGPAGTRLAGAFISGAGRDNPWWTQPSASVHSVADVMRECRRHDSKLFWDAVHSEPTAFLAEPVRWSDDLTLLGGYLSFTNAIRLPSVRKILRRSVVLTAHALRLTQIVPSSENVRHLASEVSRHLSPIGGPSRRVGILGGVRITGLTLEAAARNASAAVSLSVFQYPIPFTDSKRRSKATDTPIRALDWSPEAQKLAERFSKNPLVPRYSRLGRTERIRITPDKHLQTRAIQSPEMAYRTWQRYDLLRVGHFSGSYHHHFVWLDLFAFLQGKSPESLEMVARFTKTIAEYGAQAIFYEPNEASEELLDLITKYASSHRVESFPSRVWPISVVLDYSHLPTGNVGGITNDIRPQGLPAKAIFLDSIRVSGHLSARVRAHLLELGYSEVFDVVILDRAQDVESDRLHARLAWWSLSAPRLGSPRSCTLCRGRDAIYSVSVHTQSKVFSATLSGWSRFWTLGAVGETGFPVLRDSPLQTSARRKLGRTDIANVLIATHHALTTWTIELVSRLTYFSYVCEREDRPDVPVRTTVCTAMLLHYWSDLHSAYQRRVFTIAVQQLWSESDALRRSLLVLALSSLARRDLAMHVDILRGHLTTHGVPSLDVALAAYALIHLAYGDQTERMLYLSSMRTELAGHELPMSTPQGRGQALLSLWTTSTGGELQYRSAMCVVGIPGRGLDHAYIYPVLSEIFDKDVKDVRHLLEEACALLEPVQNVVATEYAEFERHEVGAYLQGVFRKFQDHVDAYRISRTESNLLRLKSIASHLHLCLGTEIRGMPSVRMILAEKYIHYVPLVIRQNIQRLSPLGYASADFDVRPEVTDSERAVLGQAGSTDYEALSELQEHDIVCVDRSYLDQLIRDLLLDAKHPKEKNLRNSKGSLMSVSCAPIHEGPGKTWYEVRFENRAGDDDRSAAARSRSFEIANYFAADLGGSVRQEISGQTIKRILRLPMFASSKKEAR